MMPTRRSQNWLPTIFNDFFANDWMERTSSATPKVNIIENEDEYKVEVAAPGMTKEDFHIKLNDNNELIVSMEKRVEEPQPEEKKGTYLRREFSYTTFQQSMILPENVNKEAIKARVQDGVLTIDIPKLKEEEKEKNARHIEIQ